MGDGECHYGFQHITWQQGSLIKVLFIMLNYLFSRKQKFQICICLFVCKINCTLDIKLIIVDTGLHSIIDYNNNYDAQTLQPSIKHFSFLNEIIDLHIILLCGNHFIK